MAGRQHAHPDQAQQKPGRRCYDIEREDVADEDERGHLRKKTRRFDLDRVHPLSTSRPSPSGTPRAASSRWVAPRIELEAPGRRKLGEVVFGFVIVGFGDVEGHVFAGVGHESPHALPQNPANQYVGVEDEPLMLHRAPCARP